MTVRTAYNILRDHLEKARLGKIEDDLARNYAEDVVLLTGYGVHRGHEGARDLEQLLQRQLPDARFTYRTIEVEGDVGFLEWSATSSNGNYVNDGADSYVIRNGRIVAQTIHYTVYNSKSPLDRQ
ncbi:MAG TPA: nuclear transport factor 2 family protein [Gammaproteobacteria bacterium]